MPFHGFITIHAASLGGLKPEEREYFPCLGLAVRSVRARGLGPSSTLMQSEATFTYKMLLTPGSPAEGWLGWILGLGWDSDAVQSVSDFCRNT